MFDPAPGHVIEPLRAQAGPRPLVSNHTSRLQSTDQHMLAGHAGPQWWYVLRRKPHWVRELRAAPNTLASWQVSTAVTHCFLFISQTYICFPLQNPKSTNSALMSLRQMPCAMQTCKFTGLCTSSRVNVIHLFTWSGNHQG